MPPKKNKKKQDDYWDTEFNEDAVVLGITPAAAANEDASTPTNDQPEDEGGFGLMAQVKRANKSKKKQVEAVSTPPPEPADEDEPVITIKTKAQKEKEKKERQKLAKKQAASGSKEKKEDAAPVKVTETVAPVETSAKGKKDEAPAKGKKKGGPPVAALKKLLEAQKAAELERQRQEEEERKRIEEEERRIAEEERAKEEAKRRKKEKEKAKREQLKQEGKLLTKAQKEAQQRAQQRMQQLLQSGVKVAGLTESSTPPSEAAAQKKKVVYTDKKKKKPTKTEEEAKAAETKKKEEAKDSWDQSDDESVKDAWDATTEEEESDKEEADGHEEDTSSGSDSESSESEAEPNESAVPSKKKEEETQGNLRSPICVILGHVDTGKTKLLDKIRQTNVQEGEAGGITQQIGATYFPIDIIEKKTEGIPKEPGAYKVPGLLVIDTPGHESFTNLRSRGSSLCNIAILVVDIMHGLEPQTLESLRLLRDRKTPFIVALNKIDRIYGWQAIPNSPFQDTLKQQPKHVKNEFHDRVQKTILAFNEQGLNACLYFENKNFARNVSFVPTSAITGEGIPDLLHLLVHLTQTRMSQKLMYLSELQCTVLEVKVIEGLGTTIDVILSNGVLREGDRIVLCGLNGPIATNIRALLTPQPLRELRVKSAYVHHKSIKAAMGVKIVAPDLEKAIAGSRLLVVGPNDDEDDLMDDVMSDLQTLENSLDKSGKGVSVQASTLGSLEALLEFLRVSKIPVAAINIGPVYKKDVIRCGTMLERAPEFAVMLCFDVKVDKDAQELADEMGIKVFKADIIYHLFDAFVAYNKEILEQKRKEQAPQAVFPCILRIIPGAIFNKRDPIILGCDVVEGAVRLGTPICVVRPNPETGARDIITLGKVGGLEQNHKSLEVVKKGHAGGGVAVRIDNTTSDAPKLYGRHFDEKDELYSMISRGSIDVLKESFRDDVSKEEWALIVKLKKILDIQ